jgi:hypothetical protein
VSIGRRERGGHSDAGRATSSSQATLVESLGARDLLARKYSMDRMVASVPSKTAVG